MTLLFVDGFEFYSATNMNVELSVNGYVGVTNINQVAGRITGRGVSGGGNFRVLTRALTTTSAVYVGWASSVTVSTSVSLLSFRDTTGAAGSPFLLAREAGNRLTTFHNNVTVSTTPNDIWPNDAVWRSVIVSVNSNNTTGSYKVLLEGVTVLNATNIDTAVSTVGGFIGFTLNAPDGNGIDDFYYGNNAGPAPYNANLGDCRYEVIRPTSDVSVAFVRSTATVGNWICVADVSTSVSSFVETSIVGARDVYGMGNFSGIPVTVYAVIPQMYQEKLDAGTLNLRFYMEVAGVTAIGSNFTPLVSAYRWSQEIYTTQPNGAAWDTTAVNALQAGFETT